jgi:hypothetical protein
MVEYEDFDVHVHANAAAEEKQDGSCNICTCCGSDLTSRYRVSLMEYRDELAVEFQFKHNVFCDYSCLIIYCKKFKVQAKQKAITDFFQLNSGKIS